MPGDKVANRSFLIDSEGAIQARYDKIHMFDVDLEDGKSYRESATYQPGASAMLAKTPWGKLGMTVCYNLRFPQLYRDLARAGPLGGADARQGDRKRGLRLCPGAAW